MAGNDPRVFISYRRDDAEGHAGRLFDALSRRLGPENVFLDVASIALAGRFDDAIREAVRSCDVLLAVIGPGWLTASDAGGSRRLDDPGDWVRLEIEAALEHGIRIIPALIRGARMPADADLPESLRPILRWQAVEMTAASWAYDVERLTAGIEGMNRPPSIATGSITGAGAAGDAEGGDGFRYDAYVSYVDREPGSTWVWDSLVPRLEEAGLRVAVSGDVDQPGVDRVVSVEQGITEARRTVVILSSAYLGDHMADFENVLAQTVGIDEGTYRVIPVNLDGGGDARLPPRLRMLTTLDLGHPSRGRRNLERLVQALKGPLPRRGAT